MHLRSNTYVLWCPHALVRGHTKTFSDRDKSISTRLQYSDGVWEDVKGGGVCHIRKDHERNWIMQTRLTTDFVVQSKHVQRVAGGEIGVSLDALSGWHTGRITRVKVPDDERLIAGCGNSSDIVVVSSVRGSHEGRVDAHDAFERCVDLGPVWR
jgi:hypothetical protein